MSTAVALQELEVREPLLLELLDEAECQPWPVEYQREIPDRSAVLKVLKWASIAGLLVLGGLWSRVTPIEVVARFVVAAGAIIVLAQSLLARRYAAVAVCVALVLLYNPMAPLFDLSGGWQRVAFAVGAAPFLAFLVWRDGWRRLRA